MTGVINEMCKSEAGYAILECAADMGYELKFDKQAAKEGLYGYADPCEECCVLSPKNTLAQNIVTLAHELRHAYQFTYEKLDELGYTESDTKTMLLKNRTMEADAECYGCLVAWELKEHEKFVCFPRPRLTRFGRTRTIASSESLTRYEIPARSHEDAALFGAGMGS